MKVKLIKLDPNAKVPFIKRDNDFCFDVYATSIEKLHDKVYRYHTGIGMQIVRDTEYIGECDFEFDTVNIPDAKEKKSGSFYFDFKNSAVKLDLDFRPRSSVWETGLSLCNCEPTIDEPYTGEIMLNFYQVIEPDDIIKPYEVGDKIGQCKIGFTLPIEWVLVDELDKTNRGADGFGSSGRK